jgi:hypothetical protein
MVRLLRKLRTRSQPKHGKSTDKKPRGRKPDAAQETDGPRNFYKEEENRTSRDHAARASVLSTAAPPD